MPLTCIHGMIIFPAESGTSLQKTPELLWGQMHSLCTKLPGVVLTEITDLEVHNPQNFN